MTTPLLEQDSPRPRINRKRVPWFLAVSIGVQAGLGLAAVQLKNEDAKTACLIASTALATTLGVISPGLGKR